MQKLKLTFGGEPLIPDLAATRMLLLVAGHKKGNPRFQQRVPRAFGNRSLATIYDLDSLWISDRELPGPWNTISSVVAAVKRRMPLTNADVIPILRV